MTLNCYKFEFSENFAGFRRVGRQQLQNEWRWTRTVSDRVATHWMYFSKLSSLRWFAVAVDFFAWSLYSRTAVARLPYYR